MSAKQRTFISELISISDSAARDSSKLLESVAREVPNLNPSLHWSNIVTLVVCDSTLVDKTFTNSCKIKISTAGASEQSNFTKNTSRGEKKQKWHTLYPIGEVTRDSLLRHLNPNLSPEIPLTCEVTADQSSLQVPCVL